MRAPMACECWRQVVGERLGFCEILPTIILLPERNRSPNKIIATSTQTNRPADRCKCVC